MTSADAGKRLPSTTLEHARKLRRDMTPQERALWARLRAKQLSGLKFRRQHPMGRYIVDFYCHAHRLVVELDGDSHAGAEQQAYDDARTRWLRERGLRVLRFTNQDVGRSIDSVLEEIARHCDLEPPSSSPPQA